MRATFSIIFISLFFSTIIHAIPVSDLGNKLGLLKKQLSTLQGALNKFSGEASKKEEATKKKVNGVQLPIKPLMEIKGGVPVKIGELNVNDEEPIAQQTFKEIIEKNQGKRPPVPTIIGRVSTDTVGVYNYFVRSTLDNMREGQRFKDPLTRFIHRWQDDIEFFRINTLSDPHFEKVSPEAIGGPHYSTNAPINARGGYEKIYTIKNNSNRSIKTIRIHPFEEMDLIAKTELSPGETLWYAVNNNEKFPLQVVITRYDGTENTEWILDGHSNLKYENDGRLRF